MSIPEEVWKNNIFPFLISQNIRLVLTGCMPFIKAMKRLNIACFELELVDSQYEGRICSFRVVHKYGDFWKDNPHLTKESNGIKLGQNLGILKDKDLIECLKKIHQELATLNFENINAFCDTVSRMNKKISIEKQAYIN